MKRVVIVGASGMVGGYALQYLLGDPAVGGVTAIGRRNLGVSHPKLTEILHSDFADCSPLANALTGHDAAVYCLGAYTGVVSDAELHTITADYTIAFARVLRGSSPAAAFSFLSGNGADTTGRSRMAFARYKGEAENALSATGFPRLYIFRPGYIYPVQPRKEPNFSYRVLRAIYPALRVLFPNLVIRADDLARTMVDAAVRGLGEGRKLVLKNRDIRRLAAICVLVISQMLQACATTNVRTSDHFDGSRFHNRDSIAAYSLWDEVKIAWELRTKKKNWPSHFDTQSYRAPADAVLHGIRVLWIGHATTLIQTPRLNIITDPILFESIGPGVFGMKTVTNPGLLLESLPAIDLILISHNHYDHLDFRSLHALLDRQRAAPPRLLVGRGVGKLLKDAGISSYEELDWNDSVTVNDARVHFLEAMHTSRRGMWDRDKTLWGSFLIDSPDGTIYFAGDTGYGTHFRRIYEKYGAPTVSLLPIGAYEPRWFMYRMHMNPDEAVQAHLDLHSRNSIGIHFGLIDNAGESFAAPIDDLVVARRAHGVDKTKFVAPRYGQVFQY